MSLVWQKGWDLTFFSKPEESRPALAMLFIQKQNERIDVMWAKAKKNYSTQYSRLVSYGSTDWASTCLPTQIGRDGGLSGVYGRNWKNVSVNRSRRSEL